MFVCTSPFPASTQHIQMCIWSCEILHTRRASYSFFRLHCARCGTTSSNHPSPQPSSANSPANRPISAAKEFRSPKTNHTRSAHDAPRGALPSPPNHLASQTPALNLRCHALAPSPSANKIPSNSLVRSTRIRHAGRSVCAKDGDGQGSARIPVQAATCCRFDFPSVQSGGSRRRLELCASI
jgi:hypothetical protein